MNLLSTRHARAVVYAAVRPRLPRAAILIAALLVLSAQSVGARANNAEASTSKPTIVLVHGAWAVGLGRGRSRPPQGRLRDRYPDARPCVAQR